MKILLDTHAFLWAITDDDRLSPLARRLICAGNTTLFLSVASLWEILIKVGTGRLDLPRPAGKYLTHQMALNRVEPLSILPAHVLQLEGLDWDHRDPFDRLLVAQGRFESLPLMTADLAIRQFESQTIWD